MGLLSKLFVEFSAKGADEVKKQVDQLKAGIQATVQTATYGFAAITASVGGWVTMGLAGTVQSDLLALSIGNLSREIAAVFLPAVQYVTDLVQQLTVWFRSLTEAQQDTVMQVVLWTAGALGAIVVLAKMVSLVATLITAVKGLAAAFSLATLAGGPLFWLLGGIAAIAGGLLAYKSFSGEKSSKSGEPGAGHRFVAQTHLGGVETSVGAAYQRAQASALRLDYAKETVEVLKDTKDIITGTRDAVKDMAADIQRLRPNMIR